MNEIDTMIDETIKNNSLVKINKNIYLTNYQIDMLNHFMIDYQSCNTIEDIIFLIEEVLETDYDEDLDELEKNIQEFAYYTYTNK